MPADALAADCAVDGCLRPVGGRGTLCAMHYKRAQRGQELNAPVQEKLTQFERVVQAGIDLADVESEDDDAWKLARERFRKAVENWSRSLLATKGGKARWAALSKAARRRAMMELAARRWNGADASQLASAPESVLPANDARRRDQQGEQARAPGSRNPAEGGGSPPPGPDLRRDRREAGRHQADRAQARDPGPRGGKGAHRRERGEGAGD